MTTILWVMGGALVLAVVLAIVQAVAASNGRKSMKASLAEVRDFTATQEVFGCDGASGLAIDEMRGKLCLIGGSGAERRVIPYHDIFAAELVEDGLTQTRTVRSSQLGGALVGGVLFGGAGAVVGALSGKSKTEGKVTSIALRVTINDSARPHHVVTFLNVEAKKGSFLYNSAMTPARHWVGVIDVAIKQADREVGLQRLPSLSGGDSSLLADQLERLADLHSRGLLSAEEFQTSKAKMLSSGPAPSSIAGDRSL